MQEIKCNQHKCVESSSTQHWNLVPGRPNVVNVSLVTLTCVIRANETICTNTKQRQNCVLKRQNLIFVMVLRQEIQVLSIV